MNSEKPKQEAHHSVTNSYPQENILQQSIAYSMLYVL